MMADTVRKPVLILGAGINGCAVARELLLNGVPVYLVDRADVATGATARSSRLIHGGLRYLEYGEFALVRESLEERTRLLRLAPQFVEPLQLFIPIASRFGGLAASVRRFCGGTSSGAATQRGLWLVRLGLSLYDFYARDPLLPRHRVDAVGVPGTPRVDPARYRWVCAYFDGQMRYPERFVVAMLDDARRLAAAQGVAFHVLTYHAAHWHEGLAELVPLGGTGPSVRVAPAAIVNATGAWGDATLRALGVTERRLFGGTKGSHFITRHPGLRAALAGKAVYAEAPDGRLIFVLPFGPSVLVGTTDEPFDQPPDQAVASQAELEYLLRMVQEVFAGIPLTLDDVESHYSGVRPLPYIDHQTPGAVTRRHWIEKSQAGAVPVLTLIGGKLTTCRSFAEQAADQILAHLAQPRIANSRARPYPGGEAFPANDTERDQRLTLLAQRSNLERSQVEAIWLLCGTQTDAILAAIARQADSQRWENLAGTNLPIGFARWVIEHEWVQTLADLVERRLLLLFHAPLPPEALFQLGRLLVEAGRLPAERKGEAVENEIRRLKEQYGKQVFEGGHQHGAETSDPAEAASSS